MAESQNITYAGPENAPEKKATAFKLSAGEIRTKYYESGRYLRREQHDYNINRSFIAGEQWVYFDTARNTINQLPRDPARTRVTMNRLWPASRHIIAKVLSRPLAFEVPPADSDDATVRGAQTAESALSALHREHNWEDAREQILWNTWMGGTAVLALDWDPAAGQPLGETEMGRPYGTGDVVETPLSILEVVWEAGTRNAEKSYWWIRAQALPPAEVQRTYNLDSKPQADAMGAGPPLTQRLLRQDRTDAPVELTLVLTYYERPSAKNPKGMVATIVGDKFVDGPNPWPFPFKDRLNMVVFRETKVPGRATGDTVLSAAVPVQAAYNASWSNIIEHLKLAGNARLMVPDAALDGVDELTDLPGEIVTYNSAAGAPSYLNPPNMPSWVIDQPMRLAEQMDDILGLHDVSQGKAPKNIQSGVGVSVLVEQDAGPIGGLALEMAHGFERFASLVLETYGTKVTEPRKATLKGGGNQVPETLHWTGASLEGQYAAEIPADSIMPRNRAAMLAFAREVWDRKIITDPAQFARMADLPDQDDMLEGIDIDSAKAAAENHLMAIGDVQIPEKFDDHQKHIERHNWFRKTKRYRSLAPEFRAVIDDHVQAHETLVAEEMGRRTALANAHGALGQMPTAEGSAPMVPPAGFAGPNYAEPMAPILPRDDRNIASGGLGTPGGGGI